VPIESWNVRFGEGFRSTAKRSRAFQKELAVGRTALPRHLPSDRFPSVTRGTLASINMEGSQFDGADAARYLWRGCAPGTDCVVSFGPNISISMRRVG
jgi:hypothetical protein